MPDESAPLHIRLQHPRCMRGETGTVRRTRRPPLASRSITCCSANQDAATRLRRRWAAEWRNRRTTPRCQPAVPTRTGTPGNSRCADRGPWARRPDERGTTCEPATGAASGNRRRLRRSTVTCASTSIVLADHFQIQRRVAGSGPRLEVQQQCRDRFGRPLEKKFRVLTRPAKRLLCRVTLHGKPAFSKQYSRNRWQGDVAGAQDRGVLPARRCMFPRAR